MAGAPPESLAVVDVLDGAEGGIGAPEEQRRGRARRAGWMKIGERKRQFPQGCACWAAVLHFAAGFGATAGAASGLPRLQNDFAAPVTETAGVGLRAVLFVGFKIRQ
jgi:hypothetical protein